MPYMFSLSLSCFAAWEWPWECAGVWSEAAWEWPCEWEEQVSPPCEWAWLKTGHKILMRNINLCTNEVCLPISYLWYFVLSVLKKIKPSKLPWWKTFRFTVKMPKMKNMFKMTMKSFAPLQHFFCQFSIFLESCRKFLFPMPKQTKYRIVDYVIKPSDS